MESISSALVVFVGFVDFVVLLVVGSGAPFLVALRPGAGTRAVFFGAGAREGRTTFFGSTGAGFERVFGFFRSGSFGFSSGGVWGVRTTFDFAGAEGGTFAASGSQKLFVGAVTIGL